MAIDDHKITAPDPGYAVDAEHHRLVEPQEEIQQRHRHRHDQVCRYLVKDFGTSQSPKSTRQRDSRYCP
ncbi:MAG: hypothetical protein G8D58_01425, partial [gamma proteobacterium symbiont of Phacoides pectinatus]